MANITTLFEQGHDQIRLPAWNPSAYIQLERTSLNGSEYLSPTALLVDPIPIQAAGMHDLDCRCIVFEIDGPDWEPFVNLEASNG